MLLVKGAHEGHTRDSHYLPRNNLGLPTQKTILHMFRFQGTHGFVTYEYQVTF